MEKDKAFINQVYKSNLKEEIKSVKIQSWMCGEPVNVSACELRKTRLVRQKHSDTQLQISTLELFD